MRAACRGALLLIVAGALAMAAAAAPAAAAPAAATPAAPTPEEIKGVAADMVCLCGSCNRESLATCLCGAFAVPEREHIGQLLVDGLSSEEIVADYVERFGPMVLANPPEGYDVVWIIPFVVLAAGIVGVRQVLVYWRRPEEGATPATGQPATAAAEADTERLRRELDHFEN